MVFYGFLVFHGFLALVFVFGVSLKKNRLPEQGFVLFQRFDRLHLNGLLEFFLKVFSRVLQQI